MTFIFRYLIALFFLINSGFSVSSFDDIEPPHFVDDHEPIKIPREFEPCFKLMVEMDSFEGTLSEAIAKMEPVRDLMGGFLGYPSDSSGWCGGLLIRYKDMLIEQEARLKRAYNDVDVSEILKEERHRDKKKSLNYYNIYSEILALNCSIRQSVLGEDYLAFWTYFDDMFVDRYLIPDPKPSLFFNKYDRIVDIYRLWFFMHRLTCMNFDRKLFEEGGQLYKDGATFKESFFLYCFGGIRNCLVIRNSNNRYLPGLGMPVPPLELDRRLFPYTEDEINKLALKITTDSLESVRKTIAEIQYE